MDNIGSKYRRPTWESPQTVVIISVLNNLIFAVSQILVIMFIWWTWLRHLWSPIPPRRTHRRVDNGQYYSNPLAEISALVPPGNIVSKFYVRLHHNSLNVAIDCSQHYKHTAQEEPGEACPYIEIQDNSLALSILNPTSALKNGLTT